MNSKIKYNINKYLDYVRINEILSLARNCSLNRISRRNINNYLEYINFINTLSCTCKGIGYWGGFCLNPSTARKMYTGCDVKLATYLSTIFQNKRIVDLGGGLGWYCEIISKKSKICDEFDGAVNVEEITNGKVKYLNLAEKVNFECNYDIAISIEVAEHIPREYEDVYVNNLIKCSKEGILISWSRIGQKGHFHVNNKMQEDVIKLFEDKGLKYDIKKTNEITNEASFIHLKRNILYFIKY